MTEKPTYEELEQRIQELEKTEFELKKSQKALKESKDRYRSVVEDMPVLICSFLASGEITFVNRAYCAYFDKTAEALKGLNFLSLIPEVDQQAVMDNISALTVENQTQSHEHRVIVPTGDVRWQRWTNRALFNARGDVVGYQSIGEDITEYNRAEEDLLESEEKYRMLVEGIPGIVYSYSIIRGGIYYSPNVQSVLGHSESHLLDNPQLWHDSIHPEDIHRVDAVIKGFKYGKPFEIEYRIKDTKGNWRWFFDRSIGRQKEDGEVVIDGIATDITEYKRAEEALRESEKKLTRSKKMESLGLLAGGVAHDLNNVLSGIVSYPELILLDLPIDSKFRKPIETMQASGHRATAIVQDLLTVARGAATTKKPLNINDLISDYLSSPEFKKLGRFHPTVTVNVSLGTDLLNIDGSPVHIRKVVMNLVSNAAEAIESSGNVTISTKNRYIERPLRGYDDVNRVIEIHPNQKAIIISGFAESDEVKEAQKLGAGRYIKKPVTLENIGLAIKQELKK